MDFLIERMTRQGLAVRSTGDPAAVAAAAVGLQAQDAGAARLGIRARSSVGDEAAVVAAYQGQRSVVRTWLMRATVHLVATDDVGWMTALFGPMIERRYLNSRWRQLGITEPVIAAAIPHVGELLAGRELSRHEIARELAARGIAISADRQAATHLLLALSSRGIICRARDLTIALVADWVADALGEGGHSPTDPLAELARRYFRAFGPATAADFASWSGLAAGPALTTVRDELTEVDFDGRRGWTYGEVEPVPGLRLLPMFDNYLLGYRDRTAMLEPARYGQVYVGGMIKATVVCDGRVIASWRLDGSQRSATLNVTPLQPFTRRHRRELERERADLERFLGREVGLAVDD